MSWALQHFVNTERHMRRARRDASEEEEGQEGRGGWGAGNTDTDTNADAQIAKNSTQRHTT